MEPSKIYAALSAAQAEMTKASKDSENPHFRSKYADLSSVQDACMPALTKHGIAVIQKPGVDAGGHFVETILAHGESGETLSCRIPMLLRVENMQGYGSALTYARRYGLQTMAGIAPEDDDGNAAVGDHQSPEYQAHKAQKQEPIRPSSETIDALKGQVDKMLDIFGDTKNFWEWWKAMTGRTPKQLDDVGGKKIVAWLKDHEDFSKWGEKEIKCLPAKPAEEAPQEPSENDDKPATTDDMEIVTDLVLASPAFSNFEVFKLWFKDRYEIEFADMTLGHAKILRDFIQSHPDVSTWPESDVECLTKAMIQWKAADDAAEEEALDEEPPEVAQDGDDLF